MKPIPFDSIQIGEDYVLANHKTKNFHPLKCCDITQNKKGKNVYVFCSPHVYEKQDEWTFYQRIADNGNPEPNTTIHDSLESAMDYADHRKHELAASRLELYMEAQANTQQFGE